MTRTLFWVLNFCCSTFIYAQTDVIQGTVANFNNKTNFKVYIATYSPGGYNEIGSSTVDNSGQFKIALKEKLKPSICLIYFDSGDTIAFVGGSDKVLNFNARWYENMIIKSRFTGSGENDLLKHVKDEIHAFKDTEDSLGSLGVTMDEFDAHYMAKAAIVKENYQQIQRDFNRHLRALQQQNPNAYCTKSIIPVLLRVLMSEDSAVSRGYDNNRSFQHHHFFDYVPSDTTVLTNPFLKEKIYTYMNTYVNQQDKGLQEGADRVMSKYSGNEMFTKYALSSLTDYCTERNNFPLLDYLYANYFNTCDAPALHGKSAEIVEQLKRLSKGNKAPELIMPDTEGKYFWLSQMKPQKYVVLFFWASWCEHCQKAMPDVLKYYHEVKPKGVDFVAVSLDDNKEQWLKYISKNKLDWTNISDVKRWDSEAVRLYALRGTPTFYVLDSSLNIVGKTNEFSDLKKLVK